MVKNIDFVLHQAAIPSVPRSIADPINSNYSNINGTLNLLIAARDESVKRFVYASSSSIYGDGPELPKQESLSINPISPYSLTKYTEERYTQLFWKIYKLPTIVLRYFNVFGPKQNPQSQYAAVIPKFITAFFRGEKPVIYGDGEQARDSTYVDNIIEAMASGLPVIASDVGGISESVINERTGFLIPPRNPEILAQKIIYLIENPNLRKKMREAGRKRVKEKYSLDKMIAKIENLLDELIKKKLYNF